MLSFSAFDFDINTTNNNSHMIRGLKQALNIRNDVDGRIYIIIYRNTG